LFKILEYLLAPFRLFFLLLLLLDIHIIHQFTAKFGLLYLLHANGTLFSSPELKAQVSFSDRLLSVVCLSVNFYIFDFFSRTTGPNLTRLGTNHPWGEGILNCSTEGDCLSPRGDNSKRVKIF
jgi:hypothetical protein